jgi:phosphocarrier protein
MRNLAAPGKGVVVPERRATIASRVGLHARPAALFAKAAAAAPVRVTISKENKSPVNAASVLSLMTLGAEHGDEVVLAAEGDGADAALEELAAMLERDLDAEQ